MCGDAPIGFKEGDYEIAKWWNLTTDDKKELDGVLTSPDFRNGPVTMSFGFESLRKPEPASDKLVLKLSKGFKESKDEDEGDVSEFDAPAGDREYYHCFNCELDFYPEDLIVNEHGKFCPRCHDSGIDKYSEKDYEFQSIQEAVDEEEPSGDVSKFKAPKSFVGRSCKVVIPRGVQTLAARYDGVRGMIIKEDERGEGFMIRMPNYGDAWMPKQFLQISKR